MTADEFQARHAARYSKVVMRLMPLKEALAEADADWQKRKATIGHDLARAARRAEECRGQ